VVLVADGSGNAAVLGDGQVSVRENSTVNMTCEVDAVPPPSTSALNWYRNGSLVFTGQYYVISAVQRHDAGEYRCTSRNTLTPSQRERQTGVGHATFNLVVMCKNLSLNFTHRHTRTHAHTHTHTGGEREREAGLAYLSL